jgi:hypothetical protein
MTRFILFHKYVQSCLLSRRPLLPFQISQRWNHSQKDKDSNEIKDDYIKRIEVLEKKSNEQEKHIETIGSLCIGLFVGSLFLVSQINSLENKKQNK